MSQRIGIKLLAAAMLSVLSAAVAHPTEGVVVADTYLNSANQSTNYGGLANLFVNANGTALLQFDLSSLPTTTTASQIASAKLKLYVNRVNTSGSFNVTTLTSPWSESTVTYANFANPLPLGSAVATAVQVTTAQQFIVLDITAAVQTWVAGTTPNYGIAITTSSADVVFDSKESDETSHAAHLDITVTSQGPVGPSGTIGIGTTTTGAAGTNASVTNTGTSSSAVLNFTIPKGATGSQGPAGPTGPSGTAGIFGTNDFSFSQGNTAGASCTLGSIMLNVSTIYGSNYLPADGRLLAIETNTPLFSLIGVNYGGNGTSNFGLPNLTAAAPNGTSYLICVTGVFPEE